MKVILSKWWNYIQQSPRGSISHCSLTGKINWDLLIHRERPRPSPHPLSFSRSQRKGLRVISFPSNTPACSPSESSTRSTPNTNVRCFQVCYQDVKRERMKSPTCRAVRSFVRCRMSTHKGLLFKYCFCISLVFLCIVPKA